jgi:hypothetical protein
MIVVATLYSSTCWYEQKRVIERDAMTWEHTSAIQLWQIEAAAVSDIRLQ